MTVLPLALLSSSLTQIGAIAAIAALVGIAGLSLLVFSQAREIKRLREWAGRAPERAAEIEQRVTASAAARAQAAQGGQMARPVPRATPIQARAVPPNAQQPAGQAALAQPAGAPAQGTVPVPVPAAAARAGQAPAPPRAPVPPPIANAQPQPAAAVAVSSTPASPSQPAEGGQPLADAPVAARPASAAATAVASATAAGATAAAAPSAEPPPPAPATAAASAAAAAAPPAPSPPRPPVPPAPPTAGGDGVPAAAPTPLRAQADAAAAPEGARLRGSSAERGSPPPARAARAEPRRRGASSRAVALMAAAAVLVVAAVVLLLSLKGSSNTPTPTKSVTVTSHSTVRHAKVHHASAPKPAPAVNAAETSVAVLNGTETNGLAHRISGELQQSGYSQATALGGRPPGANQHTVVQYSSGHRGEAEAVAHSLGVSLVQPVETAVTSFAGTANVVVIVGADRAG